MASEALRLFDDLPEARAADKRATAPQGAWVLMPNRLQMELRPSDLESLLPEGHRARMVWGYVEHQDLSAMYEAGRESIAPEILYANRSGGNVMSAAKQEVESLLRKLPDECTLEDIQYTSTSLKRSSGDFRLLNLKVRFHKKKPKGASLSGLHRNLVSSSPW